MRLMVHLLDRKSISPKDRGLYKALISFCFAMTATFLMGAYIDNPARAEATEATAVHATFGLEYAVPNGPRNIAEESPYRIWYTAPEAGGIGYVEIITQTEPISGTDPLTDTDPLTGTENSLVRYRTEFFGFGENSEPYDLVYDDGTIWFTLRGVRALGKMDAETFAVEFFTLKSAGAAPTGIALAANGTLWIAQSNGRVSNFDPTTEQFLEILLSDDFNAMPTRMEDVAYQNARNIWFTMPDANMVAVYDTVRGRFFSITTDGVDEKGLKPMSISIDATGTVWVTSFESNKIGRYSPSTNSVWVWFDSATPNGGPGGITSFIGETGLAEVWYTENSSGTIGRLQFASTFVVKNSDRLGPNTPAGNTWGVIRTSDGHIWVADSGRNLLYELTAPFIHRMYVASVVNEQSPIE